MFEARSSALIVRDLLFEVRHSEIDVQVRGLEFKFRSSELGARHSKLKARRVKFEGQFSDLEVRNFRIRSSKLEVWRSFGVQNSEIEVGSSEFGARD